MKLACRKNDLLNVIQTVQNIVSPRATLPILSHVLVNADDGQLKISATDLEVGVHCLVSAEVKEKGAVTLPGRMFAEIVRLAPDDKIQIESEDSRINIKSGKSRFRVGGLPAEEFPRIPVMGKEKGFSLSMKDLKDIIRKTLFATSKEESRYALNGVLFRVKGGELTAVATDGRRLALVKKDIKDMKDKKVEKSAILPSKGVSEINRIIESSDEPVDFSIGDNEVLFKTPDVMLMARLIKGEFVDYDRVIPKDCNIKITIPREDFLSVLRRVSILTSETSKMVKFTLSGDKMAISANTELGESSDEIDVEYKGDEEVLSFNPDYLIDYLQSETSEKICFEIVNPRSPAVLRPAEDDNSLYIAMPIKLQ